MKTPSRPTHTISGDRPARAGISCLILLVVFTIAASGPAWAKTMQRAGEDLVDQAGLVEVLSSGDIEEIRYTMNLVKVQQDKGALLPFVQDLWARRSDKHPDLPWDVIEQDAVRIELAHILILADDKGPLLAVRQAINDYAFALADSGDSGTAMTAILILGLIGEPSSIPKITDIAKSGRSGLFLAAAVGLSVMCQAEASAALHEISDHAPDKHMKRFFEQVRASYASYNKQRCQ